MLEEPFPIHNGTLKFLIEGLIHVFWKLMMFNGVFLWILTTGKMEEIVRS